mmetsp:Transcript_15836/g.37462  ORF Transcript_15836/g.37462 Transcript_15836/m.37462 type:complete len:274 (+) Transcript_15836:34-855(+)
MHSSPRPAKGSLEPRFCFKKIKRPQKAKLVLYRVMQAFDQLSASDRNHLENKGITPAWYSASGYDEGCHLYPVISKPLQPEHGLVYLLERRYRRLSDKQPKVRPRKEDSQQWTQNGPRHRFSLYGLVFDISSLTASFNGATYCKSEVELDLDHDCLLPENVDPEGVVPLQGKRGGRKGSGQVIERERVDTTERVSYVVVHILRKPSPKEEALPPPPTPTARGMPTDLPSSQDSPTSSTEQTTTTDDDVPFLDCNLSDFSSDDFWWPTSLDGSP